MHLVGDAAAEVERERRVRRRHRQPGRHVGPARVRTGERGVAAIGARRLRPRAGAVRRGRARAGHARQAARDERAVAGAREQKAFTRKALERVERRLARYAELARELARRRQPRAGGEASVDDGRAQLPIDLAGEVAAIAEADLKIHGMVTRASDEFAILARRRRPMRHARRTPPSEAGAPARTQDAARPATCSAAGAKRFAAPAEWNLVNRNVSQNQTISQRQAIFVIDLKIKLMK
ncbi:Uncharacterised protein [Burkholderia pseudomallei]|nr:Uncharacterised protein [Burkholderia pseudomallei]